MKENFLFRTAKVAEPVTYSTLGLTWSVTVQSRPWMTSLDIPIDILYWLSHSINTDYNLWIWCATHVFSLTVSGVASWGTVRSELGKVALKIQEMSFQRPKDSETSWGPSPRTSQKAYSSRSVVTPSVNLWPCAWAQPKSTGSLLQWVEPCT